MRNINYRGSRSPNYAEGGFFMLLFLPTMARKCTRHITHVPFVCSLNLLFDDALVTTGVVVCLSSLVYCLGFHNVKTDDG